jgi:predicted alpha/beta superfamily hydrolase
LHYSFHFLGIALMLISRILLILCALAISACGDSKVSFGGSEIKSFSGLARVDFSNTVVEMAVDNLPVEGLGEDFPLIENQIIHQHGDYDLFYLQSDQYIGWQYEGDFEYTHDGNDEANLIVNIPSTGRKYSIHYVFSTASSGTWQGEFNNGLLKLNGTFLLKASISPKNYDYQGTIIEEQEISSTITTATYPYQVYLPIGYQESDKVYPVMYITDGQWEFWRASHAIETSLKEIILVSITQGPEGRRVIDYRLPGSHQYLAFLSQEMLPLIESQYRIDSSERALVGYSYGGLLIRHALITEVYTPLFKNFISIDGSYWHEDDIYKALENEAFTFAAFESKQLYLSGASRGGNDSDVRNYIETLNEYNLSGLDVFHSTYEVEHGQITAPSIRDALLKIYP